MAGKFDGEFNLMVSIDVLKVNRQIKISVDINFPDILQNGAFKICTLC